MRIQQICFPGPFAISFNLPGPVDPRLCCPRFRPDGILEALVMRDMRPSDPTNAWVPPSWDVCKNVPFKMVLFFIILFGLIAVNCETCCCFKMRNVSTDQFSKFLYLNKVERRLLLIVFNWQALAPRYYKAKLNIEMNLWLLLILLGLKGEGVNHWSSSTQYADLCFLNQPSQPSLDWGTMLEVSWGVAEFASRLLFPSQILKKQQRLVGN